MKVINVQKVVIRLLAEKELTLKQLVKHMKNHTIFIRRNLTTLTFY